MSAQAGVPGRGCRRQRGRSRLLKASCLLVLVAAFSALPGTSRAGEEKDPAARERVTFLGKGLPYWAERLISARRAERAEAVRALTAEGERALPMLGALLHSADPGVRQHADEILGRIGPVAVPLLMQLADRESPDVRFHAISVLGDLAPDSHPAVGVLASRLTDEDPSIATEAAWALGALREKAAPAVDALVEALAHDTPLVRLVAAGALASIGRPAKSATSALASMLKDPVASARRSAAEALAAIGPDAVHAVPALIDSLTDDTVYVRLCAAGALGSIGKNAHAAIPHLRRCLADPGMQGEVAWALGRITGKEEPHAPVAADPGPQSGDILTAAPAGQWPMWGGSASRNAVSRAKGIPETWDVKSGGNIRWCVSVGSDNYGSPIVVDGTLLLGSDNQRPLVAEVTGKCGVLVAFEAFDGKMIWQDAARDPGHGLAEFLLPATTSTPLVEGDRLYYVTAQCTLRCLDMQGFYDNENDGPARDEEDARRWRADVVWEFDIGGTLGVFPHEASNCSVLSVGDLLMVCTSNGVNEAHTKLPAPRAPSFIAVHKKTGALAWRQSGPGESILHGQWSSPAALDVNGRTLTLFGGGDGWLYALDPRTGREIWRYDGNPKDAVWRPGADRPGVTSRNSIVASPVVHRGRVYLVMGQDPWHGTGTGRLHCIDPGGQGDVTEARALWINEDVGRSTCAPIIHEGLLYLADLSGCVHCLDATTGVAVWRYALDARVWGAMLLADGKLFVGDEEGVMTVLRPGRTKKIISQIAMGSAIWSAPTAVNGTLYVATADRLFAIAEEK